MDIEQFAKVTSMSFYILNEEIKFSPLHQSRVNQMKFGETWVKNHKQVLQRVNDLLTNLFEKPRRTRKHVKVFDVQAARFFYVTNF